MPSDAIASPIPPLKLPPWDFFPRLPQWLKQSSVGKIFIIGDSFYRALILQQLKQERPGLSQARRATGREINTNWWEENIENTSLPLFGNWGAENQGELWIVDNAEEMMTKNMGFRKSWEREKSIEMIFLFSKETAAARELAKWPNMSLAFLTAVKYWERPQLFEFLRLRVNSSLQIDQEARDYLDQLMGDSPSQLFWALKSLDLLKSESSKRPLKKDQVQQIFPRNHLDLFVVREMLGEKKFLQLFQLLAECENLEGLMPDVMGVLMRYLIKVSDPEDSLVKKNTKYMVKLRGASRKWDLPQIVRTYQKFQDWKLAGYHKDPLLEHEVKCLAIKLEKRLF